MGRDSRRLNKLIRDLFARPGKERTHGNTVVDKGWEVSRVCGDRTASSTLRDTICAEEVEDILDKMVKKVKNTGGKVFT